MCFNDKYTNEFRKRDLQYLTCDQILTCLLVMSCFRLVQHCCFSTPGYDPIQTSNCMGIYSLNTRGSCWIHLKEVRAGSVPPHAQDLIQFWLCPLELAWIRGMQSRWSLSQFRLRISLSSTQVTNRFKSIAGMCMLEKGLRQTWSNGCHTIIFPSTVISF